MRVFPSCLILFFFITLHVFAQTEFQKVSMFRGNPQLTGVYDSKPVYGLNGIRFTFKTEGPIRSTAAVSDGVLYFGSGDENFYALDAETGKERWHFKTGGAVNSSPAIVGGIAYFTSRDGKLYALQVPNGSEVWKYQMGKDLPYENGWDYYLSSPCIDGQSLYVGSGDGYLYAFEVKTGKLLWKFNTNARIRTTPAVISDVVIFGNMAGSVYSLNKKDGSQRWKFSIKGASLNFANFGYDVSGILCSPAVDQTIVTVGGRDGFLYAVDLATGKLKWSVDHEGSWVLATAIKDGKVFAASGSSAFVQSLDKNAGTEQWRFKSAGAVFSSMALAGDMMCFGDYNGNIYALNNKTGEKLWTFPMGTRSFSSPVIYNGMVYCSSDDGVLYALSGSSAAAKVKVAPSKAVFWEGVASDTLYHWFQNGFDEYIRDYFKGNGYEVVDSNSLKQFMEKQLTTKSPSVIVFADNRVPKSVVKEKNEKALIRKYLDGGGKVVFLGPNPLSFKYNAVTGQVDTVNYDVASKVFGIPYDVHGFRGNSEVYDSRVTDVGIKWGLRGWWVGYGSLDPSAVNTVLARNEYGYASSWVKSYGGPEGTGLVQLTISRVSPVDLAPVRMVAEYGLEW